jgi:hypothetical protein
MEPRPRRQAPLEHGGPKSVVQLAMHRLAFAAEVERKVENIGSQGHDKWSNGMMKKWSLRTNHTAATSGVRKGRKTSIRVLDLPRSR